MKREREGFSPVSHSPAPPPPPLFFLPMFLFTDPTTWPPGAGARKNDAKTMIVLFKGAELRDTQKTQVIKRLVSPQTSFGVRSSRIHFSPTSVGERWMRDERTSKDVWGEAIKRYAGIRFKQSRAVNPQRLQILRIDREGMNRHDVICAKKKTCEKDVVGIVTFDLIGLLPTNHIIAHITVAYRSL